MNKIIRASLSSIAVLVLSACNLFVNPTQAVFDISALKLTVQTQNNVTTFSQVGQVITYNYVVTNTGTAALTGPVMITDAPRQATCPAVNTVGDLDNFLDLNETVTCTATYAITESDFNTGSVINVATATVGGVNSNQSGVTLSRSAPTPSGILTLAKSANPTSYGQVGQTITYTYVITNAGTTPLGPTQFTISDNKFSAAFNCGPADTIIAPNQTLNCSQPYIITQADMNSANLTNTATASGASQISAPATVTLTNLTLTPTNQTATPAPSGNFSPGSTIQHTVAKGEWMFQIARCYGASINDVKSANPQIPDPNTINLPATITVPRIGSLGRIYGPPCVTFQNAQSGDTWTTIAQRYNACVAVLQLANSNSLVAGASVRVPMNSAGLYCPDTSARPATAVPGITPTTGLQRITLDPGKTTATRIGLIAPNERIQFVINAPQGQVFSVRLTAPANEVAIGVTGPSGLVLKSLDATPTWSTTVIAGGDHIITLQGVLGSSSKSYTLDVSITAAVTPTATPTATATPTPTATSTPQ